MGPMFLIEPAKSMQRKCKDQPIYLSSVAQ